jgi:3-phosphoinositide dependent protein kinase-1
LLYTCFVGVPPFHTDSNYGTFQKIQKLEYTIPDFVPPHAKSLISQLLVLDPQRRIGSGEHDSDYRSIREHPFYAFVDWDTVATRAMPAWEPFFAALQARDTAKQRAQAVESKVPELLMMKEFAILEGMVTKRRRLSVKTRRLVLTNRPRLFYVDMNAKVVKGDIPLTKDTKVVLGQGKKWVVEVPGRKYLLTAEDVPATSWKAAIEKVLEGL